MKKLIVIILVLLSSSIFLAQDTLVFHTGEKMCVRVNEVSMETIQYKKCSKSKERLRRIDQAKIKLIKYSTGEIDSISFIENAFAHALPKIQISPPDRKKVQLYSEGKLLGEKAFGELLRNYPEPNKQQLLIKKYEKYKKFEQDKNLCLAGGIACSFLSFGFLISAVFSSLDAALYSSNVNNSNTYMIIAGVSGIAGIGFFAVSTTHTKDLTNLRMEIITLYNN